MRVFSVFFSRPGVAAIVCTTSFVTLLMACANGTTLGIEDYDAGAATTAPTLPGVDGGKTSSSKDAAKSDDDSDFDAGTAKDSATRDSATPAKDSGTTTPTGAGDCTGTMSMTLGRTYDDACDAFFVNTFGEENPCTPGANNCAALDGDGVTFCCHVPTKGSFCEFDYFGTPQCIPK